MEGLSDGLFGDITGVVLPVYKDGVNSGSLVPFRVRGVLVKRRCCLLEEGEQFAGFVTSVGEVSEERRGGVDVVLSIAVLCPKLV